jgi:hypothetical protein
MTEVFPSLPNSATICEERSNMKTFFLRSLIIVTISVPLSSLAQEPTWWTEMKRNCRAQGGEISEYYNSYTGCHLPSQPSHASKQEPYGPNVVWNEEDKAWQPAPGYGWVSHSDDNDFRVMRIPPNVVWNEEDKAWQPAPGYGWVSHSDDDDFRVMRIPPNVIWNEEDRVWQPKSGYDWVSHSDDNDFRVMRIPPPVPAPHFHSDPDVLSTRDKVVDDYIFVACNKSAASSDECSRNFSTATDALTDAMAAEAVGAASRKMLTLRFPSVLDRAEQIKLLFDLENRAITFVQLKINADVKKLGVFSRREPSFFEVQAEIARDVILVNKIHQEAVEQAKSGMNWEHDWMSSTHTFRSNAYDQAVKIHFGDSLR